MRESRETRRYTGDYHPLLSVLGLSVAGPAPPSLGAPAGTPRARGRRALLAAGAAVLASAAAVGPASAVVTPRLASFESGNLGGFSQTNAVGASLRLTSARAYAGSRSAVASYGGGTANAFARGDQDVRWRAGDSVWYGAAFWLRRGFEAAMQGEVALMRWDNWPLYGTDGADVGGLVIWGSDAQARVKAGGYHSERTLVGPFHFPEGRWVWAEIHQRLSRRDGRALTQVYLDGRRIGSSRAANMSGRPIDCVRYGLVALEGGIQTHPLRLWFDRASIARRERGPLGPRRR